MELYSCMLPLNWPLGGCHSHHTLCSLQAMRKMVSRQDWRAQAGSKVVCSILHRGNVQCFT
jgi:hypothetical protein